MLLIRLLFKCFPVMVYEFPVICSAFVYFFPFLFQRRFLLANMFVDIVGDPRPWQEKWKTLFFQARDMK